MSGDLIPLSARIIQVCDAWVAMTSNDSYRVMPLSRHDAGQKIREAAGSQFDEAVVARFLRSLNVIVG